MTKENEIVHKENHEELMLSADELIDCETLFGKEFFWNELETIVEDGAGIAEDN